MQYDSVIAAAGPDVGQVRFPDDCPERRFALTGTQVRIGRRSVTKEVVPDIDLSGPPADPGISRLHAILISQPDGVWSVIDPGSANGTTVNDVEIMPGETVELRDGDRIGIGAWTLITIVARASYVEGNLRNGLSRDSLLS
jgi:pSer/pThr/pTyr-binding forkhead associated (FHA) protein